MLHPVPERRCPSATLSPPPKSPPRATASQRDTRVLQPDAKRFHGPVLRAAHGFIFSPVMRVAGGVMGWRLQRDGFAIRDIATPGGHVRVWDARGHGRGPCVVFIHGLGGSSREYRNTLVWLQSKCRRVLAVDMPSHGGSATMGSETERGTPPRRCVIDKFQARINHALDQVLDEPANLVGHSLGGYAVMRYALEGAQRSRVRGLVLVSPDGAPWTPQELADDGSLFEVNSYTQAADIATRTYPQQPMRAAWVAPFIYARFAMPHMQYLTHSDVKQPTLTPAQLGALPSRVRLVFGKHERFDPPHNLTYFRKHLPPGMTLAQPDTGHGDIVDAHPGVLAAIADFLV